MDNEKTNDVVSNTDFVSQEVVEEPVSPEISAPVGRREFLAKAGRILGALAAVVMLPRQLFGSSLSADEVKGIAGRIGKVGGPGGMQPMSCWGIYCSPPFDNGYNQCPSVFCQFNYCVDPYSSNPRHCDPIHCPAQYCSPNHTCSSGHIPCVNIHCHSGYCHGTYPGCTIYHCPSAFNCMPGITYCGAGNCGAAFCGAGNCAAGFCGVGNCGAGNFCGADNDCGIGDCAADFCNAGFSCGAAFCVDPHNE